MNYRPKNLPWYHQPYALVLFFGVFLLMARGTYASLVKHDRANDERSLYEANYQELVEKRDRLKADIERLETARGREEEFRERFNATKPGEQVIRIIEE